MITVFVIQTKNPTHLEAVLPDDSPIIRFIIPNAIYIGLFIIAVVTDMSAIALSLPQERRRRLLSRRRIMRCWLR
jgi:hypothetical protein